MPRATSTSPLPPVFPFLQLTYIPHSSVPPHTCHQLPWGHRSLWSIHSKAHNQRKRQTSEKCTEKWREWKRRLWLGVDTSLLLHVGCLMAGSEGSGWASGLWLGLREWRLPLPDSAEQSEPEESELECLTRLPCVCALCADKLSVNTHTQTSEWGQRRSVAKRSRQMLLLLTKMTSCFQKNNLAKTFKTHDHNVCTCVIKYLCPSQEAGSWVAFRRRRKHKLLIHSS